MDLLVWSVLALLGAGGLLQLVIVLRVRASNAEHDDNLLQHANELATLRARLEGLEAQRDRHVQDIVDSLLAEPVVQRSTVPSERAVEITAEETDASQITVGNATPVTFTREALPTRRMCIGPNFVSTFPVPTPFGSFRHLYLLLELTNICAPTGGADWEDRARHGLRMLPEHPRAVAVRNASGEALRCGTLEIICNQYLILIRESGMPFSAERRVLLGALQTHLVHVLSNDLDNPDVQQVRDSLPRLYPLDVLRDSEESPPPQIFTMAHVALAAELERKLRAVGTVNGVTETGSVLALLRSARRMTYQSVPPSGIGTPEQRVVTLIRILTHWIDIRRGYEEVRSDADVSRIAGVRQGAGLRFMRIQDLLAQLLITNNSEDMPAWTTPEQAIYELRQLILRYVRFDVLPQLTQDSTHQQYANLRIVAVFLVARLWPELLSLRDIVREIFGNQTPSTNFAVSIYLDELRADEALPELIRNTWQSIVPTATPHDIDTFVSRIYETLDLLVPSPTDRADAPPLWDMLSPPRAAEEWFMSAVRDALCFAGSAATGARSSGSGGGLFAGPGTGVRYYEHGLANGPTTAPSRRNAVPVGGYQRGYQRGYQGGYQGPYASNYPLVTSTPSRPAEIPAALPSGQQRRQLTLGVTATALGDQNNTVIEFVQEEPEHADDAD